MRPRRRMTPAALPTGRAPAHPFPGDAAGPSMLDCTDPRYRDYRTLQTMVIVGWILLPWTHSARNAAGDYSPVKKGQQLVFGTRGATEVHRALRPNLVAATRIDAKDLTQ